MTSCINNFFYPSSFNLKNEYGNNLSTFNKRSFLQGTSDIFKLFIVKKVHTYEYRKKQILNEVQLFLVMILTYKI